jgi:hypothetical protein
MRHKRMRGGRIFRTVTGLIDSFSLNASLGRMNEIPQTSKNERNDEIGGPKDLIMTSTEEELGHDHRRRNCD